MAKRTSAPGKTMSMRESHTKHPSTAELRLVWFRPGFWRSCAQRLRDHDVLAMSAALTYRTIFAMIPVLILGLLVAKAIGTLEDGKRSLRTFLEASGFAQIVAVQEDEDAQAATSQPEATGSRKVFNVADEIEKIVAKVEGKLTFARLGPVGGLLLIWTALGLMSCVEQSLNRVFEAERTRGLVQRMLLYWSALTLGPVLLAVAAFAARKATDLFPQATWAAEILPAFARAGPTLVGILLLACLYRLLPSARVRFSAALAGAAVAVLLWSVAKWGFAIYVDRLVLKGNLYGVLGVLPLFLLWLYYSWLAVLFGAELTCTASRARHGDIGGSHLSRNTVGPSDFLAVALAVARAYVAGRGPIPVDELAAKLRLSPRSALHVLDRLKSAGLVCAVPGPKPRQVGYAPARPPQLIALREVLEVADPRGALLRESGQSTLWEALAGTGEQIESALKEIKLADLVDRVE